MNQKRSNFNLRILESLYIHRTKPTLNDKSSAFKLNIVIWEEMFKSVHVTERSCCDIWKCVGLNVLWQMRYFVSVGRNVTSLLYIIIHWRWLRIELKRLKMEIIEMLVRFFFAWRHKLPHLIHQVFWAVVDRLKPLEASRYQPVLFNSSISLLKALELGSVVLLFLKMSPNPTVTFFSTSYSNRSWWLVFWERII